MPGLEKLGMVFFRLPSTAGETGKALSLSFFFSHTAPRMLTALLKWLCWKKGKLVSDAGGYLAALCLASV